MSVAESSTTAASAAVSKKRTNAASSPLTDVDSLRNKRRKSRSSFAIEIPPLVSSSSSFVWCSRDER